MHGKKGLEDLFTIYLHQKSQSSKLQYNHILFCGVQTKNQSGLVDWKDSYKWSKSYSGIVDINNYYLILLSILKTTTATAAEWIPPTDSGDSGRVSYQGQTNMSAKKAHRLLSDGSLQGLYLPNNHPNTPHGWAGGCLHP
ncbi:hypothetical protein VP01_3717g1 [Puccinia sorghi]|uniref:Uncharacterized protein n=1 Tax=Puccinia sorghi TaxID=27349 RepID=A0A0L6UVZ7_9BASI|nr:hypothetical protein VP01_3717g1 [Puccinia sorghi]